MANNNYEFVDMPEMDPTQNCPIKIKGGKYDGIVFRYGKISLQEQGEDLNVTMDIDIVTSPDDFDKNEKDFTNQVGEIFLSIVESGVETKNVEPIDLEDDVHSE